MSDLALDLNPGSISYGKLLVDNGDLAIITEADAIRQDLLQRLRLFLGEWFLDTSQGVPYYQNILVKNPNLDVVSATLQNVILSTPGVIELLEFFYDYNNATRALSVTFSAKTTNGKVIQVTDLQVGV